MELLWEVQTATRAEGLVHRGQHAGVLEKPFRQHNGQHGMLEHSPATAHN